MSTGPEQKRRHLTWDASCRMGGDERVEIVDGEFFAVSPAPRWRHQHIVTEVGAQGRNFLQGESCLSVVSSVDVKLSEEDIVQPDVVVVCDRSQIKDTHIEGAPSLVVEVLFPHSHFHDRFDRDGDFRSPFLQYLRLDLEAISNFPLESGEEATMIVREERRAGLQGLSDLFVLPWRQYVTNMPGKGRCVCRGWRGGCVA